jgi:hypothetical protein
MMKRVLVAALLLAAACKETPPAATVRDAAAAALDAAPSQANPPADGATATAPTGATVIGVEACDEYLEKMARCIAKLSPESAEPVKRAMDDTRKAWQDSARTEQGRTALADACRAALDAAKSSAEAMGCPW